MHKVRYVSRKAHHAVLRKSGFLPSAELPLSSRGFAEGDTGGAVSVEPKQPAFAEKSLPGLWPRQSLSQQELTW